MTDWIVKKVPCCVCGATGKVKRRLAFTRDCPVCEGEGQRKILLHRKLTPQDQRAVITSAIMGSPNYAANPAKQMISALFGERW